MKWTKLERGNDWGTDYYTLPGESKNERGICKRERGIALEGSRFDVLMPDRTTVNVIVNREAEGTTISILFATTSFHGMQIRLKLDGLMFDLDQLREKGLIP